METATTWATDSSKKPRRPERTTLHQPLKTFDTLRSVGYLGCSHPRMKVNTEGALDDPLTLCMDCGARDGRGGSIDYPRHEWPEPS
jgi:hypothetical protein